MLIPKRNYKRDEKFRRWIAQFPCFVCGIHLKSQAAHLETGGRGIKTHDKYCVSLCHSKYDHNGNLVDGCHTEYDQYKSPLREMKEALKPELDIIYALYEQGRLDEAEVKYRGLMLW
jgi:hypothetical protein